MSAHRMIGNLTGNLAHVALIDTRDPIGDERLNPPPCDADSLRWTGATWRDLREPMSASGRCLRNEENAREFVADCAREAEKMLAAWRAAEGEVDNGRGGGCVHYPVAIVLCNYGAHVACDDRLTRVVYFRD
jgi:hypothetical protein